jgi:integrase
VSVFKRTDRSNHWYYRRWVTLPSGRVKISGKAPLNTKVSALEAERAHVERVLHPAPTPPVMAPTVAEYAEQWLGRRTNANAGDDRTRLTLHALPHIGTFRMDEVKPRHLRDLVLSLRGEGKLAPRTIRQVSGLLHTMFKSAAIEEVITANPVIFERGTLPQKSDKDPTWRHEAIYTRDEVEALISDERLLPDRRIIYALKSLGALRHSEAANLRWSQYDASAQPLGAINLGLTKSGVPRAVPVHPTLAKLLAAWKLSGWSSTYGRTPTADDFIVPTRNMTEAKSPRNRTQARRVAARTRRGSQAPRLPHKSRREAEAARSRPTADVHHPRADRRRHRRPSSMGHTRPQFRHDRHLHVTPRGRRSVRRSRS